MRATIHNGRTSKDGAYNTKHNDRQFDIVLCDGLYEQGFATKTEALSYLRDMKRAYPRCVFTIYDVDNGSERELDRIWYSYRSKCEEFERD